MNEIRVPVGVPVLVGRNSICDLRTDSLKASRTHLLIGLFDGVVRIRDLATTNGTWINAVRQNQEHVLSPGDEVAFGSDVLTWSIEEDGAVLVLQIS